jgi:Na+/proline symporter
MDLEVQHNCDGEMAAFSPQSACADVVGLGWGGILVAIAVVLGLGVVGWLLWRRMRNRGDLE